MGYCKSFTMIMKFSKVDNLIYNIISLERNYKKLIREERSFISNYLLNKSLINNLLNVLLIRIC